MAKRSRLDTDQFFSGLDEVTEVNELKGAVAELQEREAALVAEITNIRSQTVNGNSEELEAQIAELREKLKSSQGSIDWPVSKMKPNPKQTRKSFKTEVNAMAKSLLKDGQLADVILFDDGTIFDGECRWRGAQQIHWTTLRSVIVPRPQEDKKLRRQTYLANRLRHDLNPLDKAEAITKIICDEALEVREEEVPRIISRILKRLSRFNTKGEKLEVSAGLLTADSERQSHWLDTVEIALKLTETERKVLEICLDLQEHPGSLERNIFPFLNIAADLKIAIRESGLTCNQAKILEKLSAKNLEVAEAEAKKLREQGVSLCLNCEWEDKDLTNWVSEQLSQNGLKLSRSPATRLIKAIKTFNIDELSNEETQELKEALQEMLIILRQ